MTYRRSSLPLRPSVVMWLVVSLAVSAYSVQGGNNPQKQAANNLGKSLYDAKCTQCHDKEGKGNGPASAFLNPQARDLTAGKYKFRSTESGSIPTDEDLLKTIQNGLHGTAMPDWKPFRSAGISKLLAIDLRLIVAICIIGDKICKCY